jgi:hypothetical protein
MTFGALLAIIFGVVLAVPLGLAAFINKKYEKLHPLMFFNCSTIISVVRALIYLAIFLVFPSYKAKLDVIDPTVLKTYEPCIE